MIQTLKTKLSTTFHTLKSNFNWGMIGILVGGIYFWLFVVNSFGASVILQCDPNAPEEEVTKYEWCWANYSGNTNTFPVTNCNNTVGTTTTFSNLVATGIMYFRVRAHNISTHSPWSNKVKIHWVRTPTALKFQSIEVR